MSLSIVRRLVLVASLVSALALPQLQAQMPQAFTEDQLLTICRNIKLLGEDQVADMVEKRGVDFKLREGYRTQLRKLGATDLLLTAVQKASDARLKQERETPAIGSAAAAAQEAAKTKEKQIPMPPELSEKAKRDLVERARARALEYTSSLPAFICSQVTRRYYDPTGRGDSWHKQDDILANVSYDEKHHENYKLVTVNNAMTDKSFDSLGGATSMGEFGSLLLSVFDPESMADFDWLRQGAMHGRAVEVYAYHVEQPRSRWLLEDKMAKARTYPAYRGKIWVDRETGQVFRLSMTAVDIEKGFPIHSAESTLDYDFQQISGVTFLLPVSSEMQLSDGRVVQKNEIQFRLYRKFSAESSISFGGPEDETPKETPKKKP